jgi:hypothetical protein
VGDHPLLLAGGADDLGHDAARTQVRHRVEVGDAGQPRRRRGDRPIDRPVGLPRHGTGQAQQVGPRGAVDGVHGVHPELAPGEQAAPRHDDRADLPRCRERVGAGDQYPEPVRAFRTDQARQPGGQAQGGRHRDDEHRERGAEGRRGRLPAAQPVREHHQCRRARHCGGRTFQLARPGQCPPPLSGTTAVTGHDDVPHSRESGHGRWPPRRRRVILGG